MPTGNVNLTDELERFVAVKVSPAGMRTRAKSCGRACVLIVRLPDSEQWRVDDHLVGWFSDPDARTWERCMWSQRCAKCAWLVAQRQRRG